MIKNLAIPLFFYVFINNICAKTYHAYRSEYEEVGDFVCDLNSKHEFNDSYWIYGGNDDGHFEINEFNGIISIRKKIQDYDDKVTTHTLIVKIHNQTFRIIIRDGFDYYTKRLKTKSNYKILKDNYAYHSDGRTGWTAFNNVWGKGNATVNEHYKIAIIHKKKLPGISYIIWDTKGSARDYGGQSVWGFPHIFYGYKADKTGDVKDCPFHLENLKELIIDPVFRKVYGTDHYKIAVNLFTYKPSKHMTQMGLPLHRDGDFFFVPKQVNNYTPPNVTKRLYPDLTLNSMNGTKFQRLFLDHTYINGKLNNDIVRRKLITVHNPDLSHPNKNLRAKINLKKEFMFWRDKPYFDNASSQEYFSFDQWISNIAFGVEITKGHGCIMLRRLKLSLKLYN